MQAIKRFSLSGNSKPGRLVKPVAKNAVISASGGVSVDIGDALATDEVKAQLKAVRNIREASRRIAVTG